jgi:hypothetical protein
MKIGLKAVVACLFFGIAQAVAAVPRLALLADGSEKSESIVALVEVALSRKWMLSSNAKKWQLLPRMDVKGNVLSLPLLDGRAPFALLQHGEKVLACTSKGIWSLVFKEARIYAQVQ